MYNHTNNKNKNTIWLRKLNSFNGLENLTVIIVVAIIVLLIEYYLQDMHVNVFIHD